MTENEMELIRTIRKSKDPANMNAAANDLEHVMQEVGCTVDPNADYRADYTAHSAPDADDDAMDADFEEI